ncbi:MAG: DUF4214 domain-containing protein [Syntrophobacterales bacterium]|nr:DUF4214 domain-containing protein [Syntrophobacterales bacterium]
MKENGRLVWCFFLVLLIFNTNIALAVDSVSEVQRAYIAYYGRPADPGGLDYWSRRLANEGSLSSIMQEFGNSQEFRDRFGRLSYPELVNNIYLNLFNRNAEEAGKQFYVNKLQRGEMTLQTIALNILYGAENEDKTTIENKVEVAKYFTQQIRNNPSCTYSGNQAAEEAKKVISFVNATKGSINAGKILTDYRYCRVLRCPLNVTESLVALSRDQQAFIASRGNPSLFTIVFTTEEADSLGRPVYSGRVRKVETWIYNNSSSGLKAILFDNGYFIEEKTVGPYAHNLVPTHLSPSLFTPCTTKEDVIRMLGEPTCTQQIQFGGRLITAMRYNPTTTLAASSVYLENDLVFQVEAGYALVSPRAGSDLCKIE